MEALHFHEERFVLDRIWPDHKSVSYYFMLISTVRFSDPYSVTGLRWTLWGVCFSALPDISWPFVHLFQPQWAGQSTMPSHTHTHAFHFLCLIISFFLSFCCFLAFSIYSFIFLLTIFQPSRQTHIVNSKYYWFYWLGLFIYTKQHFSILPSALSSLWKSNYT